jgi:hypothetical protein
VPSHLGSSSETAVGTLRARVADREGHQAVWDRWNAMTPAQQAAGFVEWEGRLVEALEALTDQDLAGLRLDLGFLPWPVDIALFVDMRLSEVALHRWDVDVAFDPQARLAPYPVPFVLWRLPMFAGFSSKPIGKTGFVAIQTSDPARSYLLELTNDGASLAEAEAPAVHPGTTVRIPAEAFVRLTAGRLAPGHTPDGMTVDGAISLDDLRNVFPHPASFPAGGAGPLPRRTAGRAAAGEPAHARRLRRRAARCPRLIAGQLAVSLDNAPERAPPCAPRSRALPAGADSSASCAVAQREEEAGWNLPR